MRAWMKRRHKRSDRKSRRLSIGCEQLESRIVLDAGGFTGNDCPPDLDLSQVADQSATVGQLFTLDLPAAGATIVDLNSDGSLSGDDLTFLLDPDIGTDTPDGATIDEQGVFMWTPSATQEGVHTIYVILVDEGSPPLADVETFEITVAAAPNAAPVVDLNGGADGTGTTTDFTEDGGAVLLAADATISDSDSTTLQSATISFSSTPDGAAEALSVDTTGTSLSASYDATTGALSLTGEASVEDYETVLRTLRYENTSDTPDVTAREVSVTVNDGDLDSAAVFATVNLTATNDSPDLAEIEDVTAILGSQIEINVTATDAEGDTLTFFLDPETAPEGATIETTSDTSAVIRWTPQESDGAGPHEFIVLVSDSGAPTGVDSEQFFVTVNMAAAVVDLNGEADGLDSTAAFVEDGGSVVIVDSAATISDANNSELTGLTATITNLLDAGNETLSVDTTGTTITANFDAGVLTLTGTASVADYEAVLRTLSYENTSNDPTTTDRVIEVAADDGNGVGNVSTSTVSVAAVNDPPNLTLQAPYDDPTTAAEVDLGTTISFNAIATDVDNDASELTFMLDLDGSGIPESAAQPTIDDVTGAFSWTPDVTGCFEVTVIVTDTGGLADQQTFLVLVEDGGSAQSVLANSAPQSSNEQTEDSVEPALASEISESATPVTNTDGPADSNDDVVNSVYAEMGMLPAAEAVSVPFVDSSMNLARTIRDQVVRATFEVEPMDEGIRVRSAVDELDSLDGGM